MRNVQDINETLKHVLKPLNRAGYDRFSEWQMKCGERATKEAGADSCPDLIHESSPRQMGHGFQFVVEEKLRQHEEESKRVDAIH